MIIKESEMNFGDFDDDSLFYIERSNLYQKLGPGFKTVDGSQQQVTLKNRNLEEGMITHHMLILKPRI